MRDKPLFYCQIEAVETAIYITEVAETLQPVDLTDPRRILEMGIAPVQIHVMSAISGVSWDEAWRTRAAGVCGDQTVAFLGRDAFLQNKRAAARPKDLADIDALEPGDS